MRISSEPKDATRRSTACRPASMKSADAKIIPLVSQPSRRERLELAFLPAALEIIETPASPTGRVVGFVLIALFCIALTWACVGKVDLIAAASGKIVPTARTKTIQPFETGVVRAIHVEDGQSVRAGDVLIELDPTLNDADRDHLRGDLMAQQLEAARLDAVLSGADDPARAFVAPPRAEPSQVAQQLRLQREQMAEQKAKVAALESQRAQKKAERETALATIDRFEATIPILRQELEIYKTLFTNGNGSKLQYLHTLESLTDREHELAAQRSRVGEADAALAAIGQSQEQTKAEFRRTLTDQLVTAEAKAAGLLHDVSKAEEKGRLQRLTAPIDGTVQQLAVHTVGGVVTPAQALLALVPTDTRLEIEAMLPNREVGFVQAGQSAEIKIDTFNFTRYGLRHGYVLSVSQDSIARDRRSADRDQTVSSQTVSSEPRGQELLYSIRVALDATSMRVDDRDVRLTPGMETTVEIKTGQQRIIHYLLSPLLRYAHDIMRER